MKIAVVGTGVSGLVAAHLLHRENDLTVYEAADHVGGHILTSDVELGGRRHAVDAGFIVYNERNYPNFTRLLDQLGVESQATSMSFSVRCDATGLEYCGTSLDTIFAQRRNALNPRFLRLLVDVLRFNARARRSLAGDLEGVAMGEFLRRGRFSRLFVSHYLVAMTAAIWSTDPDRMLDAPAHHLLRFLDNHGLLSVSDQPEWRVIRGGSREYVRRLTQPFSTRIRTATPVRRVTRRRGGVEVRTDDDSELFDEVVLATHSDQALALLDEPTQAEREVLGAIPFQVNEAVLHTDSAVLPTRRRARASWNCHLPAAGARRVRLTYDMSRLQGLATDPPFCVSLNMTSDVEPDKILRRFRFEHPVLGQRAVAAQRRHREISGRDRIHYCGAYWRHGFHEDGVVSALEVARRFGRSL
jgi:predicted NAD/FAD-binding protein